MQSIRVFRAVGVLWFIALTSLVSHSQAVATGAQPYGSFDGGPDIINLGNLNVHYAIPIYSKPGRGIPFSYTLVFDNSMWRRIGTSGNGYWQPVANWGWAGRTQVQTGYIKYDTIWAECWNKYGEFSSYFKYRFTYYYDKLGKSHRIMATVGESPCDTGPGSGGHFQVPQLTVVANDGSGYLTSIAMSIVLLPRSTVATVL